MSEILALSELGKKLEQNKKRELEQIKKIETESMSELAESLKTSLQDELSSIEDDMTKKFNILKSNINKIRQATIKEEKATLTIIRKNRKTIEEESLALMQSKSKIKMRTWIIPLTVGFSLILGLTLGSYALGSWISNQLTELQKINEVLNKAKEKKEQIGKYHLISEIYTNGLELKKKPQIWQKENGNWVVLFEKEKEKGR